MKKYLLGTFWPLSDALGTLLEALDKPWSRSWGAFGALGTLLDVSWSRFWGAFGTLGNLVDASWAHLAKMPWISPPWSGLSTELWRNVCVHNWFYEGIKIKPKKRRDEDPGIAPQTQVRIPTQIQVQIFCVFFKSFVFFLIFCFFSKLLVCFQIFCFFVQIFRIFAKNR